MVEVVEGDWEFPVLIDQKHWERIQDIKRRYNSLRPIGPNERDGLSGEARGGRRFASTLDEVRDRTRNPRVARSIFRALKVIVDRPYAGETAWEMRRFIRRAPVGMIREFGVLMEELAEKISGGVFIDMDFYHSDCEGADPKRVRHLSRKVLNGLRMIPPRVKLF